MRFKTITTLLIILLIVIFSLQNAEVIDVKFLFWKVSVSRVLIILGSFAFGILVGLLMTMKKRLFKKT